MKVLYREVHNGQAFMFMGKELIKKNNYWAEDEAGRKYFMGPKDSVIQKPGFMEPASDCDSME